MNNLDSYTLAGHLFFWPKGDVFTNPFEGNPDPSDTVVAIDAWPAGDDPAMQAHNIGDIESDAKWTKNVEKITPRRAVGGVVRRKKVIFTYQELMLAVTTNSMSRIAFELMFGSSQRLSDAQAQFAPLSAYPKEGVLIFNCYTNEDEYVFTGAVWVQANVTDGIELSGRDIIKPKFEFEMLDSDLNTMAFGSEDQL